MSALRILFIGGNGTISAASSRLALERGHELTLLNRGVSNGSAEDLVSSVVRAWDAQGNIDPVRSSGEGRGVKPLLVAPSMNTAMWAHPVTAQQLEVLESGSAVTVEA